MTLPENDTKPTQTQIIGNISIADHGAGVGSLRLLPNGLSWAAREGVYSVSVRRDDVQSLEWLRGARGFQLKCLRNDHTQVCLEGFRPTDLELVEHHVKTIWKANMVRGEQSTKGWSFGDVQLVGETLKMTTDGERVFELPLSDVAQAMRTGKNEMALEFHLDDTAAKTDECLVEMRFQMPSELEVVQLQESISAKANTSSFMGESIVFFEELPFIVPRGRYDFELFPNYVSLHGKSFDYKILYKSIRRMFLLPKPDELHLAFVISLDPPIRQGNTSYPHLVLQFRREEEETTVELNMGEEQLKERFGEKMEKKIHGELWQVVTKILRAFVDKPLHAPKNFVTSQGVYALRTALGAADGYLYPLENCFFFVNKPPTYVRYEDIDFVEFKRLELDRRFDLQVVMLNGTILSFTNLEKNEFQNLHDFLDTKKVRIVGVPRGLLRATDGKSTMRAAAARAGAAIAEEEAERADGALDETEENESDEEDEDFAAGVAAGDGSSESERDLAPDEAMDVTKTRSIRPSTSTGHPTDDVSEASDASGHSVDDPSDDSELEAELIDEDQLE